MTIDWQELLLRAVRKWMNISPSIEYDEEGKASTVTVRWDEFVHLVGPHLKDFETKSEPPVNAMGWHPPANFLQWKGTNVCIDLHCTCGRSPHYDGDFLYTWKCKCGRVWVMASHVDMHEETQADRDANATAPIEPVFEDDHDQDAQHYQELLTEWKKD